MDDATASPFNGLGQRDGARDDDPPVRRIVDAATAPPVATGAPASVFQWWGAGVKPAAVEDAQLDEQEPPPTAAPAPTEEPSMPKPGPRKQRATKAQSPQFQICTALLAGDLTREELAAAVDAKGAQLHQATFGAKKVGRIVFLEKTEKFHLTREGKDWVTGGANLAAQRAATAPAPAPTPQARRARRKAAAKRAKVRKALPAALPSPPPPPAAAVATPPSGGYRCAVDNGGRFTLEKGGVRIELDVDEHRDMLRYLDRMGEQRESAAA